MVIIIMIKRMKSLKIEMMKILINIKDYGVGTLVVPTLFCYLVGFLMAGIGEVYRRGVRASTLMPRTLQILPHLKT